MFEFIEILFNVCINLCDKCVDGIIVNKEVCEVYVFNFIGIVIYLNLYIGYYEGDIVGKICVEIGKSVCEVVFECGLFIVEELDDILFVENFMYF